MSNKLPAWDDLRVLLEVRRHGTFLAAGVALGMSTSTVARRVGALERELGRALVHRTSQGVRLEAEALELAALAEGFARSLATHRRDGGGDAAYAGVVRVSVAEGFGVVAAEAAARFRREHPETFVEVISELRFVDLAAREADIGVRGGRSTSPALVDKPVGDAVVGLYASEAYLAKRLRARAMGAGDYAEQDFVVEDETPRGRGPAQWLVQRGAVRFPFRSNSVEARLHAAKAGVGLVLCGVGEAPRHPELRRVRLDAPLPTLRFYLTMHRELRKTPRIRGVALALEGVLREYAAEQAKAEARFAKGRG